MAENIDLNQLTGLTTQQKAGTQELLAGQNATTADYLKRYTNLIGSQGTTSALAERLGQELGIPTLQANATLLRNTLSSLPSTYTKAFTGFDVSENQRQRAIAQKAGELAPTVTTAETSLANAQNQLGTRLGYAQSDWARQLAPMQTEQELLSNRLARETTLFSQSMTNELNALITKIQTGAQLSIAEANRAQELAIAEKNYELEKQRIAASQTASPYMTVGEGSAVYDPTTGKMVYRNPKTYAPKTGGGGTNISNYFTNPANSTPDYFKPVG